MTLLRAVCEHFVTPVDGPAGVERARGAVTARGSSPGVALLCRPGDASVLGAALGLLLAREHRSAVVAVGVWTGASAPRAALRVPALPAARRLAGALRSRGQDVRCSGRLVVAHLPADAGEAAVAARRIAAAAGAAPTVVALGGPRVAAVDELLADQDLVVVAPRDEADPVLARLAVEGLAAQAMCACTCEVPPAAPARVLAEAGLVLLPSFRRALEGPIAAMA